MTISLEGEKLELLKERAIFWPRKRILALSDVHLGKAIALQRFGIPIPYEQSGDLKELGGLVREKRPSEVYVLGDWLHHISGWSVALEAELTEFFSQFADVRWNLILGNHERGFKKILERLPFHTLYEEVEVKPFLFSHGHKSAKRTPYRIQGHVHPVVSLRYGSTHVRLPCFVVGQTAMILPSFGELTGGFEMQKGPADRLYAVGGKNVFEVL